MIPTACMAWVPDIGETTRLCGQPIEGVRPITLRLDDHALHLYVCAPCRERLIKEFFLFEASLSEVYGFEEQVFGSHNPYLHSPDEIGSAMELAKSHERSVVNSAMRTVVWNGRSFSYADVLAALSDVGNRIEIGTLPTRADIELFQRLVDEGKVNEKLGRPVAVVN